MGKTVAKIVGVIALGAALILSGGTAGLFFVGTNIGLSFSQIALLVGTISLSIGFAPEVGALGNASQVLAENLSIQSDPLAVRAIPVGRHGIAGQVLFRENIKNSGTEEDPDELLLILGLAGYPATALEKFSLNGEVIDIGGEQTADNDSLSGAITTGKFANELWVWWRTGQNATAAFPEIATLSTAWAAKTRKLRGIPAVGFRLKVTEKLEGRLEPLSEIKGAALYDPRLDDTVPGGSGGQRFDDPSTWIYSPNPKLGELLYLRGAEVNGVRIFGMGKSKSAIDLENFAAEANICAEQVAVKAGGTIDRYTMDGRLIPDHNHRTNLQQLLSASAGTMDASGGIYRTFAGAWRGSSMTLTESDIDGAPTEIRLQKTPSEEINIISGSFADPNDAWEVKEYPELRDEDSIAQLGENAKTIDLPFTIDHRIAQRISKIMMKRANAARGFTANYWLRALPLQPGDIVTQTYLRYTINSETFRVNVWGVEASEDSSGNRRITVPMQLVEEKQSWFDWDAATEEKDTPTLVPLPSMDRLPRYEPGADITGTRIHDLVNPGSETGTLEGWIDKGPTALEWEVLSVDPRDGTFHLHGDIAGGFTSTAIENTSRLQVGLGDKVLAQGFGHTLGGLNDVWVEIRFYDASDVLVSTAIGNKVSGSNYALSRVVAITPANAVSAAFAYKVSLSGAADDAYCDGAFMGIVLRGEDVIQFFEEHNPGPIAVSGSGAIQSDTVLTFNIPLPDISGVAKVEAHFSANDGNVAGSQKSSISFFPDVTAGQSSQQSVFVPSAKSEQSVRGVFTFDVTDSNADVSLEWFVNNPIGPNDATYTDIVIIVEIVPN